MQLAKPGWIDSLVCGDVGFGKTEAGYAEPSRRGRKIINKWQYRYR